jgi:DNA-binding CsgD family transcriptional regulator/tetratricopeptide (TPR) repeat protein
VGRDDLLDLADRRIAEVTAHGGRFLLLAGEAGVGKTRLLGAMERRAVSSGFRTVRGGAYPSDLQVPGAILIDLARAMQRQPALAPLGTRLAERLEDRARPGGPGGPGAVDGADGADDADQEAATPQRRRRMLVLDVAELLVEAAAEAPTVVALEDLHWTDDLTLEVLEALARRVPDTRLLVIGTYRSDELFPRAPMREWRSRLLGGRQAEEVRLARLSAADTATMTTLLIGSALPAARDVVDAIHARTDGIPLHVEELLGLLAASPGLGAEAVRSAEVPETVEDAILARLEHRSADAASVAQAGAVIGRSFDLELLASVTGKDPTELSAPLRELADHFILLPASVPGRYGFRHALICDAIYARIPEPDRRRLHARTADAASGRPEFGTGAFLALHFERAGQREDAFRAAVAAADAATALSSYTEARELYACALRTAATDLDPATRARMLEGLGASAAATDDNQGAADAFEAAREAYRAAGQPLAAAAVVGPLVAARHLLGDGLEARAERLRGALQEIAVPPGLHGPSIDPDADRVRARLLAALAAAYMLDRRLDEAISHGTEARSLAAAVADRATEHDAAATLGACFVFAGRMDEGWSMLERTIAGARLDHLDAQAARAYRMLGSCASVLVEYERAEKWLRDGIEEAERHELWNHRHYMAAHLAHVEWATGRWGEADDIARRSLADGRGGITTRTTALHVIGYVAVGRGELQAATTALEEARDLGSRMNELQRLSPALWGLAEVAMAQGDATGAAELAEEGRAASTTVRDAAYLFPFLITGTRAYLAAGDPHAARRWYETVAEALVARGIPGTMPALEHARGLLALNDGETAKARTALAAAAAGWQERGRTWEGTWAYLDLARAHLRANLRSDAARLAAQARDTAAGLGAPAIVKAAEEVLRQAGRGATPEPWAPLTAREFEIARCVAEGLTNVEIAAELGITAKTAASHVEHILAKLGVGRRAEIAVWAASRPVLHSPPSRR